ncbi:MAG: hypothetical protein KGJ59_04015 [Bacteroidota bacterium]|nr:hypothetical protein [Bacteroidota bacterium]
MRTIFYLFAITVFTLSQSARCQGENSFGASPSDSLHSVDSSKQAIDSTAAVRQAASSIADSLHKVFPDTVHTAEDTSGIILPTQALVDTAAKDTTGLLVPVSAREEELAKLDPNGYRDMHWGMTLAEVRDHVLDRDNVNEYDVQPLINGFEYPTEIAGVNAYSAYEFDSDRLYAVRLNMFVKAKNRFDFLDAYQHYQTILQDKYGEPTKTGFAKIDPSYLSTVESVILGFAKKYTFWEFPHTYLALVLVGVNRHLEIHITYISKEIFDELKDKKATMNLEDF